MFSVPEEDWAGCTLHTVGSHPSRRSLNSASFLPLGIAKPHRLPAESSAGHHGDFHMEPLKICACVCFKRLSSVPLCVSAGAVSSLWPPTVGWLGGLDPASVAWVGPVRVHPSSCSAWLTQPIPAQGPWLGRGLAPPPSRHCMFLILPPPQGDKPARGICFLGQCTLHPTELQAESFCAGFLCEPPPSRASPFRKALPDLTTCPGCFCLVIPSPAATTFLP